MSDTPKAEPDDPRRLGDADLDCSFDWEFLVHMRR
jgi:hypothetical protein